MISEKMKNALIDQYNYEVYSAFTYLAMNAYCDSKGLSGFATWFRAQYEEEMMHADKFFEYILDQSEQPIITGFEAIKDDFGTPLNLFEETLSHEQEVTRRIYNLVDIALEDRDHGTNAFLQWFVTEQVEEEATVNSIIDKLKLIEGNPNGIFMIDAELGKRTFTPPAGA